MLKKIICLLLALSFLVVPFIGCVDEGGENESETEETQNTETQETEGKVVEPMTDTGIILTDEFSFEAKADKDKLKNIGTLTRISDMDEKYKKVIGDFVYVSAEAPQFELVGAKITSDGKIAREAAGVLGGARGVNTAGVVLRFCTAATAIKIKATVSGAYVSNTNVPRGSYGFDVYVGTGTDRVEQGAHLQRLTSTNIDELVQLGDGRKEVLIYLPQLANTKGLMIGFENDRMGITKPTARDHAPVVFYGSGITQGCGSAHAGNAYTNIVTRMLNADCINLGMIDGARGDVKVAEYIASLGDISAFVMEFDHGASLDELKANHYNFYKTVRDAHPDIPIIIMNDPVLSEADRAERGERVAVIEETYKKALAAGDGKVWLLDGDDIFPTDNLLDLYTSDLEMISDTGHYYLATCIYDVLNSAFTPDDQKSGVKREVGFKDPFDVELYSYDDKIMEGSYTKVSALDAKYVNSKNNGMSYLTLSTPQLELGGLIHPDDNEGEFYRVPYSRKDEFIENLLEKNSYTKLLNNTTGGTVRFRTNADSIIIKAAFEHVGGGEHTSAMGMCGLEVFVGSGNDRVYCEARGQALVGTGSINQEVKLPEGYKEVMVTLPNYSGLSELYIGVPEGAEIAAPLERDYAPILFYGTSVTQGACASRSSLAFANLTARFLNTDLIHLGFSGSGRGEQIMADYIASQAKDISAFVMNYDGNSGVDEMAERCYPFYKTVRDANPDLPIILMSAVYYNDARPWFRAECYKIMEETYKRAVEEGDKNIYLLDCRDFFPKELSTIRDIGVVDHCHLTDPGMYYAAKEIYAMLNDILKK